MSTKLDVPKSGCSASLPIAQVMTIVRARAVRVLARHKAFRPRYRERDPDVEDMVQEVLTFMLTKYGCRFHQWDSTRGLSLPNFVGLVAERELTKILRSPRRRPWEIRDQVDLAAADIVIRGTDPESAAAERESLRLLLGRLKRELSPKGFSLFWQLLVEQHSVSAVESSTGLSRDAIYAWRSRLTELVKVIDRQTLAA
jgi:hypothetical protein